MSRQEIKFKQPDKSEVLISEGDLVELKLGSGRFEYHTDNAEVHRMFRVVAKEELLEPIGRSDLREIPLEKREEIFNLGGIINDKDELGIYGSGKKYTAEQLEYYYYLRSLGIRKIPNLMVGYVTDVIGDTIILRDSLMERESCGGEEKVGVPTLRDGMVVGVTMNRVISLKDVGRVTVFQSRKLEEMVVG